MDNLFCCDSIHSHHIIQTAAQSKKACSNHLIRIKMEVKQHFIVLKTWQDRLIKLLSDTETAFSGPFY